MVVSAVIRFTAVLQVITATIQRDLSEQRLALIVWSLCRCPADDEHSASNTCNEDASPHVHAHSPELQGQDF